MKVCMTFSIIMVIFSIPWKCSWCPGRGTWYLGGCICSILGRADPPIHVPNSPAQTHPCTKNSSSKPIPRPELKLYVLSSLSPGARRAPGRSVVLLSHISWARGARRAPRAKRGIFEKIALPRIFALKYFFGNIWIVTIANILCCCKQKPPRFSL